MQLNYFGKRKKINFNLPAITIRAKEKNQKKNNFYLQLKDSKKNKNKILCHIYVLIIVNNWEY